MSAGEIGVWLLLAGVVISAVHVVRRELRAYRRRREPEAPIGTDIFETIREINPPAPSPWPERGPRPWSTLSDDERRRYRWIDVTTLSDIRGNEVCRMVTRFDDVPGFEQEP